MICSCGLPIVFTPKTVVGPMLSDFAYLLLVNCACQSTRAAVLWDAGDDVEEAPVSVPLAAE